MRKSFGFMWIVILVICLSNVASAQVGAVSRFGLKVPPLDTEMQIKDYMRSVLYQSIPKDYVYPAYIAKAGSPQAALTELGVRYPQFRDKNGPDLIEAVKKDPITYQEMIMENRALRDYYASHPSTSPNQLH